jgi:O-acetyl-ADP-ribose deacetylase (regulator of RNase III)
MIQLVTGDFFDFEADIRVNTVNCVGVMGAGVALLFKKKYPAMFEDYFKACKLKLVKIGSPHVWKEENMFKNDPITIINFPTKDDWRKPSKYEYIREGLVWLRKYLFDKGPKSMTLPALGCGHGGLDWEIVRPMIYEYLEDLPTRILLFEPASSTRSHASNESEDVWKKEGIEKITPNDHLFPRRLLGKSAADIYIKGDKSALNQKLFSIFISSKAGERERKAAEQCIENIQEDGFVYLLSYNSSNEIDLIKKVLSKKSRLIILYPSGLLNMKIRSDLKPLWEASNVTIISISDPNQSWNNYESFKTLQFRVRVSDVLLIADIDMNPLKKVEKDIVESRNSVFFINYGNERNQFYNLIAGKGIGKDKATNLPNVKALNIRLNS